MDKKIIKFGDTEIEGYIFYQYIIPISKNNIDITKIAVSNKFLFGKKEIKYFIGYKDNKKIIKFFRPLCIFFIHIRIF